MRGKGINYDTGFSLGGTNSRDHFDAGIVRREMHVIAAELHCTAVRISGDQPERLSIGGEAAAAAGPEVWFARFRCALTTDQLAPLSADCADRAGHLRRAGARVVLVAECELTLFAVGFLPGGTVCERIDVLASGGQDLHAAFAALPSRLSGFPAATADAARSRFAGPLTYVSGMWEPVRLAPVRQRCRGCPPGRRPGTFRSQLRKQRRHGKPLAVTEFGCCSYPGAGERGDMGWAIIDTSADPRRLDGDYLRDEAEQVRYLDELHVIFATEDVDLAFCFTSAGYSHLHDADPRRDLDMASYGLVKMLPGGPGTGYHGLGWEPKLAFATLAQANWRTPTPGDAAKRRASVGHLAQRRSASRRVQRQSTC